MSEEGGKAPPGQSETVPPPPDPPSGHHLQSQSGNLEIQSGKPETQSATYQPHSASTLDSQSTLTGGGKQPGKSVKHAGGAVQAQGPVYRKSAGKLEDITCRVCEKAMKFQNYATHLKFKHPQEDNKNLRGKHNQSIKTMFDSKNSGLKRPSPFIPDSSFEHKRFSTYTAKDYDVNHNQPKDNNSPEDFVMDNLLDEGHGAEVSDADSIAASICNDQSQFDDPDAIHDINANIDITIIPRTFQLLS